MVSIKSLAVILLAAAVTAAPVVGDEHHGKDVNIKDHSKRCPKQSQQMFCCNDADSSKAAGPYTGVLDKVNVKCNTVPVNVWAVDVVSSAGQCDGKAACCTSEADQNGILNLVTGCVAFAGN
ncbi:hypothetical protein C7212DRAFT_285611 [Tuber magnatum]|uniref:Hydrophobin n=1 Tax=Tuber magnatum TaxID=42249 RepID=A0A317SG67_9PEZI|nr:hypothetical protein C7212DRAFT_285611 [Tuber magnatum]